ncbi:MAG: hypothetical protein IGR92_10270 [Leptolyngbyaceae cyanobacterium T60_A2020_046]|nr:hypothetical protein [Leptolyngbyaceae cyanobacterium T60_A2020_046]
MTSRKSAIAGFTPSLSAKRPGRLHIATVFDTLPLRLFTESASRSPTLPTPQRPLSMPLSIQTPILIPNSGKLSPRFVL